jgi:type I restriction enzyme S subunit
MRDGWIEATFGEVFAIVAGKYVAKKDYVEGGKYWIYGSNSVMGQLDDFLVETPHVVMAAIGAYAGAVRYSREPSWINNNAMALVPSENVSAQYLYLWLESQFDLKRVVVGTGQPYVQRPLLLKEVIVLPPLIEQKRIVDLISSVDLYIDALQKQLDISKKSRNAVMHQFMNESTDGRQDTQLGKIADFLNGKAYSKEELLTEGKYRVLRVGNFFSNNNWYWSDLELEPNKFCDKGDLLYAWSASFGPKIWEEEKVIYHYHIWKVNPDLNRIDKKWLFYWLEDDVERIKSASGTGSIMMHVTKAEIEKRSINLPSVTEQQSQVEILESFDVGSSALQHLISATRQLRGSMLSDLLSGKREIPASYEEVMGVAR